MCLIAWNWQPGTATPLLLLSNRDEFYARPALPLHWWNAPERTSPTVLAGRDLQAGGTWLGVSRNGRLAALTNVRSGAPQRTDTPSRGELVAAFLHSEAPAADFLRQLLPTAQDYNPFNLLVCDGQHLLGLHSHAQVIQTMPVGVGGVSNAAFHTPWPKLVQLRQQLQAQIAQAQTGADQLLPLLQDRTLAADAELPDTGVPYAWERALSAAFIATPGYGTRASSVVALHRDRVEFTEHGFGPDGAISQQHHAFAIETNRNTTALEARGVGST